MRAIRSIESFSLFKFEERDPLALFAMITHSIIVAVRFCTLQEETLVGLVQNQVVIDFIQNFLSFRVSNILAYK